VITSASLTSFKTESVTVRLSSIRSL